MTSYIAKSSTFNLPFPVSPAGNKFQDEINTNHLLYAIISGMFSKKSLFFIFFSLILTTLAFSEPEADFVHTAIISACSNPDLDLNHAENNSLYWGNPSDATSATDANTEVARENFLMEKPQFTLSYNDISHNPNWVAWHLAASDLGEADRADTFRPDPTLPKGFYAVRKNDYKFSAYGFDRGHLCPSADRTATTEANSETFLMTNMVPQSPDNNRIVWVALEKFEREMVQQGWEAYIFSGPYGQGGTGDRGYFESIQIVQKDGTELAITVPSHTWKIILFLPEGESDFERVASLTGGISQSPSQAAGLQILAVNVPNEKGCGKNGSWQQYVCSVNYIEEITGYDFFELLPDDVEEEIESRVYKW